jgi:hypothetical protein
MIENYELLYGFRTAYDEALQATWCNNCRCGACQVEHHHHHHETGPAGYQHHDDNCQNGPEYFTMPLEYKSNCMPQMQGGLFPRNLVKFGAMQPVHKPKQHNKKPESSKQDNTPVKTESHTW